MGRKAKPTETQQEQIDLLKLEIQLVGFAAAKHIVSILKLDPSRSIECPLCGQRLRFSIAPTNGHMAARCGREGCINAME